MLAVVGCQAPNLFQRIGVEGGGLAQCPVGCGALVVSCPRRVGSVYFQRALGSSPRSVLIKINDKKPAKVKSEGKRTHIIKAIKN